MKQFEKITATHLWCEKCGASMPVRERLLLVLPDGKVYDYLCIECGGSVGEKRETNGDAEIS